MGHRYLLQMDADVFVTRLVKVSLLQAMAEQGAVVAALDEPVVYMAKENMVGFPELTAFW